MIRKYRGIALVAVLLSVVSCTFFQAARVPARHPAIDAGRPVCTDCHDASNETVPYARYNHGIDFIDNHRLAALQGGMCAMCHPQSDCSRCHGGRMELTPSESAPGRTLRRMPHRGDFLARHRIEGSINPVSCFRCHGNPETAEGCVRCHGAGG